MAYFSEILLDGHDIGLYYKVYIICARVGGSVWSVCFPRMRVVPTAFSESSPRDYGRVMMGPSDSYDSKS